VTEPARAARTAAAQTARARGSERLAAAIVLALGLPLVFMYARAMADGEVRRREAPLRAMLGDDSYERLARGEKTEEHYLGDGLLAPDFELRDKDGKPWRLSDQRGKVVVMNFWTITCQPCVEELPSFLELADLAHGHDDIEVVAISTDKDWHEIAALFPPHFRLKVLFDPERKIVRDKYGTKLYPETWIIDPRGVVRMRFDGARNWSDALTLDVAKTFL
jgi:peroxiredoxin